MRRLKLSRAVKETFARFDAEDRAVVFLDKLPSKVALATALSVEESLATRWSEEQSEMMRRDDPRPVFHIGPSDIQKLNAALAAIPSDVTSDEGAEQYILHLLADLPTDQAWLVARKVARSAAVFVRLEQIRGTPWRCAAETRDRP
jgi:CO/xanthine dehydrogenase Mo-binding subunit